MKNKNILIFGATGTLGFALVRKLVELGANIHIVSRSNKITLLNVKNIQVDIHDFQKKDIPLRIDTIIYLAQSNNFRDFPNSAEDISYINTHFPVKLASWARELGIKSIVYASSGGVYNKSNEALKEFFNVDANIENGFYIGSKLSAEILLRPFSEFFENFIILRPFFIFSETQNKDMLIPRLLSSVKEGREITLKGSEGLVINPIHAETATNYILKLLSLDKCKGTFNLAGNETISLKAICEIFGSILSKSPVFKYIDGEYEELVGDVTKINEIVSIGENIRERLIHFAKEY